MSSTWQDDTSIEGVRFNKQDQGVSAVRDDRVVEFPR